MPGQGAHKLAIVAAAARLFRRQGYAATGLNEITAVSGAPKGSLYHYFPAGKAQIGAAAVGLAGRTVADTLNSLCEQADSAAGLIALYGDKLAGWMRASNFRDGCPIATVLLEAAPDDAGIVAAGREAFDAWSGVLAERLRADGVEPERARRLADFALAAIEGALIQSRVERDDTPIRNAVEELAQSFTAARGRN
jgi:TetR/AcrR family transcriptional repressor of lmrAB and yxaGH operons